MAKIVDARNLPCPQPVLLTIKALEEGDEVAIIVDNEGALENVSRLGDSRGCKVTVERKADGIYLTLVKKGAELAKEAPSPAATGVVLFISSDILGRGENVALGNLLMHSFLNTIGSFNSKPESIVCINVGVKLVTFDSLVVGELK